MKRVDRWCDGLESLIFRPQISATEVVLQNHSMVLDVNLNDQGNLTKASILPQVFSEPGRFLVCVQPDLLLVSRIVRRGLSPLVFHSSIGRSGRASVDTRCHRRRRPAACRLPSAGEGGDERTSPARPDADVGAPLRARERPRRWAFARPARSRSPPSDSR